MVNQLQIIVAFCQEGKCDTNISQCIYLDIIDILLYYTILLTLTVPQVVCYNTVFAPLHL